MANTDWSDLKFVVDQLNHEFKLFSCQTKTRTKTKTTATRLLLTLGKYRKAPRIDYGVKHKASLLIMQITQRPYGPVSVIMIIQASGGRNIWGKKWYGLLFLGSCPRLKRFVTGNK